MSTEFLHNIARPADQYINTERLVESLRDPSAYAHSVEHIQVIETHISWVLLTGPFAYKIKKPLNLGFLDYTTLQRRKYFCHEELRLNRRLAPEIYLEVVPITGSLSRPAMDGKGQPMEFAVKMRQFPQHDLLSELIEHQQLTPSLAERIANRVASFHGNIEIAATESSYGTPAAVLAIMQRNFDTIRVYLSDDELLKPLNYLKNWTHTRHNALATVISARKRHEFVRECHGDMHLGNIALVDGEVTIFDGIEFNKQMRWIDVMSELAFLVMDLDDRGAPELAQRILNHYLMETGDYAGLALLRLYQVYRALVRAKVTIIRASQDHIPTDERQHLLELYLSYVKLAERYTKEHEPVLVITHGLSGSGKSTLCQQLSRQPNTIWIRSDIERKRLHGLTALQRSNVGLEEGLYSTNATQRTYEHLLSLTHATLQAHFTALVDATFLKHSQRIAFEKLAEKQAIAFHILNLQANENTLQQRIVRRSSLGQDPSEAGLEVLIQQRSTRDPLTPSELEYSVAIDSEVAFSSTAINSVLSRLGIGKASGL